MIVQEKRIQRPQGQPLPRKMPFRLRSPRPLQGQAAVAMADSSSPQDRPEWSCGAKPL